MAPAQPLTMDSSVDLPAQPNQSLMDGMTVLQAVAELRRPVGSRELGRMLGLEPTRVNRLLKTLAHMGMVAQDEQRKYRPGPGIHVLAAQSLRGSGLLTTALPHLEQLRDLGHMVSMGVLWRTQVCYLYFSHEASNELLGTEAAFPAAESGLGLALLAELADDDVERLYTGAAASRLPSDTVPLRGRDGLLAQLRSTRRSGYALTPGYGDPLVRTVAVTIDEPAIASVGLAGAFTDDAVAGLVARLRPAAAAIAAAQA